MSIAATPEVAVMTTAGESCHRLAKSSKHKLTRDLPVPAGPVKKSTNRPDGGKIRESSKTMASQHGLAVAMAAHGKLKEGCGDTITM